MTEVRTAGPWLTPEEERAWRAFRRMMVAVQSGLAFDLTSTGLSEPDYEVLSTLSEQPSGSSPLHVQSAKMGWSRSRLSKHATRMEARGLLQRQADPHDRRGCLLTVTTAGIDALRSATPTHLQSVRARVIDKLEARDLQDLYRIAGKLEQDVATKPNERLS